MWPCKNSSVVTYQSTIHSELIILLTLKLSVRHIGRVERQILAEEATEPRVRDGKGPRRCAVRLVRHDGREVGASDQPIPQELIGRGPCTLPDLVYHIAVLLLNVRVEPSVSQV